MIYPPLPPDRPRESWVSRLAGDESRLGMMCCNDLAVFAGAKTIYAGETQADGHQEEGEEDEEERRAEPCTVSSSGQKPNRKIADGQIHITNAPLLQPSRDVFRALGAG